MMSHLHGLIHSLLSFGLPVNEIVEKANRLFNESTLYSNYATMVIGKAYPDGTIEISVAGHNPPLLVKNGIVQGIQATGIPVGLFSDVKYGVNKITMDKGDTLLLYTDGLTESSVNEVEYGEQRLIKQLANTNGSAPKILVDELMQNHKAWLNNSSTENPPGKQADDITVLAVKRMI
jgi:sigma-B regulation protein RsbU (phosphoserine phosphatase)